MGWQVICALCGFYAVRLDYRRTCCVCLCFAISYFVRALSGVYAFYGSVREKNKNMHTERVAMRFRSLYSGVILFSTAACVLYSISSISRILLSINSGAFILELSVLLSNACFMLMRASSSSSSLSISVLPGRMVDIIIIFMLEKQPVLLPITLSVDVLCTALCKQTAHKAYAHNVTQML